MNDETKAQVMAELKKCFQEVELIMKHDKYTDPPAPSETSENAQRAMLEAKLKVGYLDNTAFDELRVWAWKAYSYRYKVTNEGELEFHPLIEDVRSRIGDFTDKQLSELELVLEG